MMWQATLRDLQWRRRRFLIALTGTALVFAMSLVMSGLAASVSLETTRALDTLGADVWIVQEGASGPFTAFSPIPATDAEAVAGVEGITRADPIIYIHQTIGDEPTDINLFGVVKGGIGEPTVKKGRELRSSGEAIVDASLGLDVGDTFTMNGAEWDVVGVSKRTTINGGISTVFISLEDAQQLTRLGPIASAIVATGHSFGRRRRPAVHDASPGEGGHPAPAAERGPVDQFREGSVVDRRRVHHCLDHLLVGARADA